MARKSNAQKDFEHYVMSQVPIAMNRRRALADELRKIDELTTRERVARRVATPGASDMNIPIVKAQRKHARTRLYEALFGSVPTARFRPVKGPDSSTDINWHDVSREATDFFEYAHKQPTIFNVRNTMRAFVLELVDYGLACVKVIPVEDRKNEYSGPRWQFVSVRDLLWPEGLGFDYHQFPWFGQVFHMPPHKARMMRTWDSRKLNKILTAPDDEIERIAQETLSSLHNVPTVMPGEHNRNTYAEMWIEDETGADRVVVVHPMSGQILANDPATFERPYFVARYDEISALSFLGTGIPRDLGPIQHITNALYNAGVDAASVGLQQVRLIRADSMLAKLIGREDEEIEIGANFQAITEDPDRDLRVVPLGDARVVAPLLAVLGNLQALTQELTGLGGPRASGDISGARRAPATGITAVLQEGSFPIRDVSARLGEAYSAAILFTLKLFQRFGPPELAVRVLGDDGEVLERMFALPDNADQNLVVDVDVADPGRSGEAEQQRLLIRAQFLMGWYDKVAALVGAAAQPNIPDPAVDALVEIFSKTKELISRVIEASNDVQDVEALLPQVESHIGNIRAAMREALEAQQQQQQQQPTPAEPPAPTLPPGAGEF